MAILGSTTLTGCNSIPDFIPSGSVMTYIQAAAPTSWTRVTSETANNRMLRLVIGGVAIPSNTAGAVGGSASPILNNVVPSHTHGFTSGNNSSNHAHSGNTGTVSANHSHTQNNVAKTSQLGWPGAGAAGGLFIGGALIHGFGNGNHYTTGIQANHIHGFTTGGIDANHTHSGTTDNGSSPADWAPRYVDSLLCTKN